MISMRWRRAAWLLPAVFAVSTLSFAQEFRATVNSQITDPAGAGVPGAKIVLKNIQTNEELTGTTASAGNYTIPFAKPGEYTVTAEAQGFKKAVRENIELRVNDVVTVDFPMELGQVAETMTVTGEAPILDESTVIRGGYRIFYLQVGNYGGTYGYSIDTPFIATTGGDVQQYIPHILLSNPFPNGLLQPTGSSLGLHTFLGQSFQINNPDRKIPHLH